MKKIKEKEVFNNGEYSGFIISCSCGAKYRATRRIFSEEYDADGRKNYCRFCKAYVGSFEGAVFIKNPRVLWLIKNRTRIFFKLKFSKVFWYIRSFPLLVKYQKERFTQWKIGSRSLEG